MLIKPNRARKGRTEAEGSRNGTSTQTSLALIVTIVTFKFLPDMCCDQVLASMAEARCLIFSPRPTPLGTCGNVINGMTSLG